MTTGHAEDFGSILRRHRRAAGLTHEDLAERASLSVRGIQDLERGVSQSPRPATVQLLAQALHLSSEERAALPRAGDAQPDTIVPPAGPIRGQSPGLIPLVGRAAELSLLDQFLLRDDAGVQPTPLFLLAGEPGVGSGVINAVAHGEPSTNAQVVAPALLVTALIYSIGPISGAHLNLAVALAFAVRRDFSWVRVVPYLVV